MYLLRSYYETIEARYRVLQTTVSFVFIRLGESQVDYITAGIHAQFDSVKYDNLFLW